ncbi:MAG: Ig-like domain-containing protein [Sulfitobacter sp.]
MTIDATFTLGTTQSLDNLTGFSGSSTPVQSYDLGDGRVVSVWLNESDFTGYFSVHEIDGTQLVGATAYDPDGAFDPGIFGSAQSVFSVTTNSDGSFALHFTATPSPAVGFPQGADHYSVSISASGVPATAVAVPSFTAILNADNSATLSLSNGTAAIASDAGLTVINSVGEVIGGTSEGPVNFSNRSIYGLTETPSGGVFVVSGSTSDFFGTGFDINGQFFDANGAALGTPFDIVGPVDAAPTSNDLNGRLNVATLSDGRYAVAFDHRDSDLEAGDNSSAIHVMILNADGSVATGPFLGNPDASTGRQFFPTVHALEDGAFVVAYQTDDVTEDNVSPLWRLQVFDQDGVAQGESFFRGPDISAGTTTHLQTVILTDGRGLVIDHTGGSTAITIGDGTGTPMVGNVAPVTPGLEIDAAPNEVLSGVLSATDADGDSLIFSNGSVAALLGIAAVHPDGSFSYTANAGASGTDTFTYQVADGTNQPVIGTVTVTINATPNTPPTLSPITIRGEEDSTVMGVAAATDTENNALTYGMGAMLATNGTAFVSATGDLTYTPNDNFFGTDSFEITVTDGNSDPVSTTVSLEITAVQDAPIAQDGAASVISGNVLTTTLEASDADGDALEYMLKTGPVHGEVTVSAEGSAVYTPDAGFVGSDSFVFNVSDGADTDSGMVTVDVTPATVLANTETTLAALDGANVSGLTSGGRISISDGTDLSFADVMVNPDTGQVTFGASTFHVDADLNANSFVLSEASEGGVDLILLDELLGDGSDLSDGAAVSANNINGLEPEAFFAGNGTRDFTITLDRATSGYDNSIGTYVRHSDGSISDVQILFANTNTAGVGATNTLSNVPDEGALEFFFIQDAAAQAATLGADLSIDAGGALLENGTDTGLTTYFSEVGLNSDGVEHFLSGAVNGGGDLRVGIEDLTGGGDMDYQDVVFTVGWTDDGV